MASTKRKKHEEREGRKRGGKERTTREGGRMRHFSSSSVASPFRWIALVLSLAAVEVVRYKQIKLPLLSNTLTLRGNAPRTTKYYTSKTIYVPPSLDSSVQRRLSATFGRSKLSPAERRKLSHDLGGGNCEWTPPTYDVPEEIDFHKTIIAGFPSGDKRMIFVQMEALTGWPAKDEWDFEYLGMSNHPFIKANYPHHEGIWGWGNAADQVVMMIRNIRRSMVEYHDILWDIGYAKTWEDATLNLQNLYSTAPPIEDFFAWRDMRVLDECHWYGWFIDYWMEGGLMRDIFTHKITTPEHWYMLMMPTVYTRAELDYDLVVGDKTVTPSYDPHCNNGDVTDGCQPVAIISAEKLRDYAEGPAETAKIANVLMNDQRTGQYLIAQEAWDCIWEELIQNNKGLKTVDQRPGFVESDYNFSEEMLEEMILELNRIISKYSGADWNTKETANRIVSLLVEHRAMVQTELNEVKSGVRKLTDKSFLGPKERARRRLQANKANEGTGKVGVPRETKDHTEWFDGLERQASEKRRNKRREERKLERRRKKALL